MLRKINNVRVKPIQLGNGEEKKRARGYKMFEEPYSNIFLLAKKKSGKSVLIFNVLKKCMNKQTKLVIFCPTLFKDKTYEKIIDYFEEKGNEVVKHTNVMEGRVSLIQQELMTNNQEEEEEMEFKSKEEPTVSYPSLIDFGEPVIEERVNDDRVVVEKKRRKDKYITPEIVFVFDDLGTEMRDKYLANLIIKNRHYKCKVILSGQHWSYIKPSTMANLDYVLIWKGQPIDKLKLLHERLDLSISLEKFLKMYQIATEKKYSFFYVNVNNEKDYRMNFNQGFLK